MFLTVYLSRAVPLAKDVPYVGVAFSPQIQPNTPWYKFLNTNSSSSYPSTTAPTSLSSNITNRTYSFSTRRGRNYELGRIEAGSCDIVVDDTDSSFDPNNTSSQFYPNLLPFRPLSVHCAYPLTGNLLNDTNLAPLGSDTTRISVGANDSNFELGVISNWKGTGLLANTAPYSGTYCLWVNYLGSANLDVPTVAGKQVTISFYYRHTGATTSNTFYVYDGGYLSSGSNLLGSVALPNNSSAWTQKTITVTPSSSKLSFRTTSSLTGTAYLKLDNVQVEFGSSAGTYTTTGPTVYNLFNGFVERYPTNSQAPNRSEASIVATDAIASMSQVNLQGFYQAQVFTDTSPALYYYPMSDNAGSTTAANNSAYSQLPLTPATLNNYASNITFGEESAKTGVLGGATTGVTTYTIAGNGNLPQGTYLGNQAVQDISFASGQTYTFSFWVREDFSTADNLFFFANYLGSNTTGSPSDNMFGVGLSNSGKFAAYASSTAGGDQRFLSSTTIVAGQWYFVSLAVTYNGGNSYNLDLTVNDTTTTNVWSNGNANITVDNFFIGGAGLFPTGTSFAHFTVHRGAIQPVDYYAVGAYAQATNSSVPEQTGTRFSNTMEYFSGFANVPTYHDLGVSQMLEFSPTNTPLVDYIQTIADTEGGEWYVDGEGYVTFKDRHSRLQKLVPKVVFGDGSGEIPFENTETIYNYDPTYVYNNVTVSRANGVVVNAQDQQSLTNYFPRSYDRQLYNTSDSEAVDAAYFLLSRYSSPQKRAEKIVLTPAANPAVWSTALSLEIGDLVRINERPLGGVNSSVDCFIEAVEHSYEGQSGDWITTVTLSPVFRYYWNLSTVSLIVDGGTTNNNLVVTKSGSTLGNKRDIIAGQLLQGTDSPSGFTSIFVVAGAVTETSTTISMPVQSLGYITSGSNTILSTTLTSSILMDTTTTATLADSTLDSTTGSYLIDSEIVSGSVSGNTLTITARAQFSTIQTAAGTASTGGNSYSHLSGSTVYYISNGGVIPTGTVTEILPNQITSYPYALDTVSRDAFSTLGSWVGTLNTGTYTNSAGTVKYSTFTANPTQDFLNYPQSDLTAGQLLSIGSENVAVVSVSQPTSTANWTLNAHKVTQSAATLSADLSLDATTVTTSSAVTASAILIDNEFMTVTAGSGTTSLTVVRGTPDSAVWGILNSGQHFSGATIYTLVNAGCSGTYAANSGIIEGYNKTTAVSGTARLGY